MAENTSTCTVERLREIINSASPPRQILTQEIREAMRHLQKGNMVDDLPGKMKELEKRTAGADEVYPGIFIGDANAARDLEFLKNSGIGAVLNTAQGKKIDQVDTTEDYYRDTGIKFLGLNINDLNNNSLLPYLDDSVKFVDDALNRSEKVLIHCRFGLSRSASMTVAYLMISKKLSAEEAFQTISQKRDNEPNISFLSELCELDAKLKNSK